MRKTPTAVGWMRRWGHLGGDRAPGRKARWAWPGGEWAELVVTDGWTQRRELQGRQMEGGGKSRCGVGGVRWSGRPEIGDGSGLRGEGRAEKKGRRLGGQRRPGPGGRGESSMGTPALRGGAWGASPSWPSWPAAGATACVVSQSGDPLSPRGSERWTQGRREGLRPAVGPSGRFRRPRSRDPERGLTPGKGQAVWHSKG